MIMMCLDVAFFTFTLLGLCWASWICEFIFSITLRNFGLFLQIFFSVSLLSPIFWDSKYMYVRWLDIAPQVTKVVFIYFPSLFFVLLLYLQIPWLFSSIESNLLLGQSREFFISDMFSSSQSSIWFFFLHCPIFSHCSHIFLLGP